MAQLFRPVIEWVEEQANAVTKTLEQQFGSLSDEPVDDVLEKSEQIHIAFSALTDSESVDIVLGVGPSGLDAL